MHWTQIPWQVWQKWDASVLRWTKLSASGDRHAVVSCMLSFLARSPQLVHNSQDEAMTRFSALGISSQAVLVTHPLRENLTGRMQHLSCRATMLYLPWQFVRISQSLCLFLVGMPLCHTGFTIAARRWACVKIPRKLPLLPSRRGCFCLF